MEFTIDRTELLKSLRLAASIADRTSTMPILANVLLRAQADGLTCAATDLNVTVVASLPATVARKGDITVNAKAFHDIVKQFPSDVVAIESTDTNRCVIRAGNVEYKLVGLSGTDFPKLAGFDKATFASFPAADLADMIRKTSYAAATDVTRSTFSGCQLQSNGKWVRMLAVDGHRLSKVERICDTNLVIAGSVLIPSKGLTEIRRVCEMVSGAGDANVGMAVHGHHIVIRVSGIVLAVNLIDGQLPDCAPLIPADSPRQFTFRRVAMLEALRRVSLMVAAERYHSVKWTLEADTLRISSSSADVGEAEEKIDIDYAGKRLEIGLNVTYLIELLSEMDDEDVTTRLNDSTDPVVFHTKGVFDELCLVMPMRLEK